MSDEPIDPMPGPDPSSDLRAYRLRYQEMFEFALDARLMTDGQGLILEANHAAAALLGCRKEFLIGKPLGLFAVERGRGRFYRALWQLSRRADPREFEVRIGRGPRPRDVAIRVSLADEGVGGDARLHWFLRDVTERRRADAGRADLIRLLVATQEDERRRVARELHDSVGQLLSALLLAVQGVRGAGPLSPPVQERLDVVQRVADELGRAAHDLAVRLRPTALDDLGLKVALQAFIAEWSGRTGVDAHFQSIGPDTTRFAPEIETALYRVVQEALTNITKHAAARLISVVLERNREDIQVIIEDDGVGFDPARALSSGRLGLIGMRERVTLVGGSFQIEAAPGAGALIRVRVPIQLLNAGDEP